MDCSITNRTPARATASRPFARAIPLAYTRPRRGSINNSVASPADGEIEEHPRHGGRRLLGRRNRHRHILGGHRSLARRRDLEALRREHLADRRLEKLHLVRRRTDDQVDLPGGGARLALRSQGGPRANEQGEDAEEE